MLGLGNLETDTVQQDESDEDIMSEDPENERNKEDEDAEEDEDRNTEGSHPVTEDHPSSPVDGSMSSPSHSGGITSSEDERLAEFHMMEEEDSGRGGYWIY